MHLHHVSCGAADMAVTVVALKVTPVAEKTTPRRSCYRRGVVSRTAGLNPDPTNQGSAKGLPTSCYGIEASAGR